MFNSKGKLEKCTPRQKNAALNKGDVPRWIGERRLIKTSCYRMEGKGYSKGIVCHDMDVLFHY